MVLIAVTCPYCQSDHITKRGKTATGKQRSRCHNPKCPHQSFLRNPAYKGRVPAIKAQIIDIALNGSGSRDTARVLGISTDTVISELKKSAHPRMGANLQHPCGVPETTAWERPVDPGRLDRRGVPWIREGEAKGVQWASRIVAARALRTGRGRSTRDDVSTLAVGTAYGKKPHDILLVRRSQGRRAMAKSPLLRHYPLAA